MFAKFFSIEPEKQQRIINSALKEFAEKGFSQASTNRMVTEAGISKGLLFHYFQNKKELFIFLYDYSLDVLGQDFFGKIDLMEKDILVRWRQIALVKIQLINKYPGIFDFILTANSEDAKEVKAELVKRNSDFISSSLQRISTGIDLAYFKQGINTNRAIEIIIWTMEGFTRKEQEKVQGSSERQFNYDQIVKDMDGYLELLRNCFYG